MADTYPIDSRGYTATPGAATYLALSESFLNKARHYGTGPAYVKIGSAVRYSFAALDEWNGDRVRTATRDPRAA